MCVSMASVNTTVQQRTRSAVGHMRWRFPWLLCCLTSPLLPAGPGGRRGEGLTVEQRKHSGYNLSVFQPLLEQLNQDHSQMYLRSLLIGRKTIYLVCWYFVVALGLPMDPCCEFSINRRKYRN